MAKEKKFQRLAGNYFSIGKLLRSACISYIKKVLKENNNEISWDSDESDEVEDYVLTVTYDGGNHPEYASNAFSCVYGVKLNERGKILLNTDDCDLYAIESIPTEEVYYVANYLESLLKRRKEQADC